jgi:ParB-like chromosome segregation protein Spo0J
MIKNLVANPDNPNQMSRPNLLKLARNIGQTKLYEPLIVQPYKKKKGYFQIINGYHRARVLMKLGYRNVDCIVWNVDDVQTGIYLATLNRLGGKDDLNKRINLLRYLSKEIKPANLAKVLLQTETQIKKLLNLKIKLGESGKNAKVFLNSMVFFVTDIQKEKIDRALSSLSEQVKDEKSKAAKNAAALTVMAEYLIDHWQN